MIEPPGDFLSIRDLGLLFGGLGVIESLNFDIAVGSRTAFIGPNGAGKTTLFNLLSGVYTPTYGTIWLNGSNINDVPLHKRVYLGIGRTFQNLRLMKHLTVLENVLLGQHHRTNYAQRLLIPLNSWFNRASVAEARAAIAAVGLHDQADRLAAGLSYGMQKRVELARVLMTKPKLLLLDEPTAGLNTTEKVALLGAIKSSVGSDVTILLIEHDLRFIGDLCDGTIVLNFGRKIAEGPLTEVVKNDEVVKAYLGTKHLDKAGTSRAA
jgi:branched-chain amino acid transport system ATP-binding protein